MSNILRTINGNANTTSIRHNYWFNYSEFSFWGQHYCHWWECPPFGRDEACKSSYRFPWFTLPPVAIVNRSHLRLTAFETNAHPGCHVRITGEDSAEPQKIGNLADYNSRPRTAAHVDWNNVEPFLKNKVYQTPDISPIIQEINDNHPDHGRYLQLFIENNDSDRDARRSVLDSPLLGRLPPQLFIEYNVIPPPIAENWTILDILHAWHLTGKQIATKTDTPCHLYLRFKDEPPSWHERITYRRGVEDSRDPGLEMKEFDQIEQEQDGDTLCHLFTLDPFPAKTRIWYYFIGTIAGGDTKSRSPFFRQEYELHYLIDLVDEPWGCFPDPTPAYSFVFGEAWTS